MYWNEIKRIASAAGFFVGLLTLACKSNAGAYPAPLCIYGYTNYDCLLNTLSFLSTRYW